MTDKQLESEVRQNLMQGCISMAEMWANMVRCESLRKELLDAIREYESQFPQW